MAMARFVSGSQFGVKAGLRVGIFLALTLGFPFIVYGLIVATNARSVGGAAGALAVVAGVYLKPVIILGFVISLLSPCWARMRSLGLPGLIGLLVPFLVLMDAMYFLVAGAHWGVAFSLGIWRVNAPLFAMTALATLIAMSVAQAPPDGGSPGEHFGIAGRICGILAIVLVVTALLTAGTTWWFMARIWFMPIGGKPAPFPLPAQLTYWASVIKPFACAAFCMAMAAAVYVSRKESSGHSPGGGETANGPITRVTPPASPDASRIAFGRR
jgi:hypothetical protein